MPEDRERESQLSLDDPLTVVPGIGQRRAQLMAGLGVQTLYDAAWHLPSRHEDRSKLKKINEVRIGDEASLRVQVRSVRRVKTSRRRVSLIEVEFQDDTGFIGATFFNPKIDQVLTVGRDVLLTGTVDFQRKLVVARPNVELLDAPDQAVRPFSGVYPASEELPPRRVRELMDLVLPRALPLFFHAAADATDVDLVPANVRVERDLVPLSDALARAHMPKSEDDVTAARRRLVFGECFLLQAALAIARQRLEPAADSRPLYDVSDKVHDRAIKRIPFDLTDDQRAAIDAVRADLTRPGHRMRRLLMGDVGTGKTAVAVYAMLTAVGAGMQAALLAPTEVLAQQHARTLATWLGDSKVRIATLVGGLPASERADLLTRMAGGDVDIVVGTHALLSPDVAFANLGLAVIDEQHKFGVQQREFPNVREAHPSRDREGADPHKTEKPVHVRAAPRTTSDTNRPPRDRHTNRWWTRHGSTRWIWERDGIESAVRYVMDEQGQPMARGASRGADQLLSELPPVGDRKRRTPLAYLFTCTTYGTWVHGDSRGSVLATKDGPASVRGSKPTAESSAARVADEPVLLDPKQQEIVLGAVLVTAEHRGWAVLAAHVRTNHLHAVVVGEDSPERMLTDIKAYASRALNEHRGETAVGADGSARGGDALSGESGSGGGPLPHGRGSGGFATPHVLIMSATPIPRTLAMTVYGDMDVTTLRERPTGATQIDTRWIRPEKRQNALDFLRARLELGERAYVVTPAIEDNATLDIKGVETLAGHLREVLGLAHPVGILHGRLNSADRESALLDFADGRTHVLVSTTVVEVGVDVPEATVIVIEHAERFGLAQLHQLRGRVGRAGKGGTCLLLGKPATEDARERIRTFVKTSDGFAIAEADLALRGPGEFFGTRQHGMPRLRATNLLEPAHEQLLQAAREAAFELVRDGHLDVDAVMPLIKRHFGDSITIVGERT